MCRPGESDLKRCGALLCAKNKLEPICITTSQIGDGKRDCPDGGDEIKRCPGTCIFYTTEERRIPTILSENIINKNIYN